MNLLKWSLSCICPQVCTCTHLRIHKHDFPTSFFLLPTPKSILTKGLVNNVDVTGEFKEERKKKFPLHTPQQTGLYPSLILHSSFLRRTFFIEYLISLKPESYQDGIIGNMIHFVAIHKIMVCLTLAVAYIWYHPYHLLFAVLPQLQPEM